jgi:uncharacterized protein
MFQVTSLFVGLFALLQVPMTLVVALRRARTKIQFSDGGDAPLLRQMRAHANFVETVPMALLAMAAAEYSGAHRSLLVAGGLALLCGRLTHYLALVRSGFGIGRVIGMVFTLVPMVTFGVWSLAHSLR